MEPYYIPLAIGIIAGAIGRQVARSKGRDVGVWTLFCFFVPILLLVLLCLGRGKGVPTGYKRCPFCAEPILKDAITCRYCHKDVDFLIQNDSQEDTKPCAHCGADVRKSSRVCVSCGRTLTY